MYNELPPIIRTHQIHFDSVYILDLHSAHTPKEIRKRKGERTAKVVLAAGLPLTGFGREKQKFKEYLFQKQLIRFLYEGERYKIQIEDVKLFPQGYSALALYPEYLKDEPSVLLVDIGGWTVEMKDARTPETPGVPQTGDDHWKPKCSKMGIFAAIWM